MSPSLAGRLVVYAIYAFLFVPLAVVVLFSFSDRSFFVFPPEGFSLRWYAKAWDSGQFVGPAIRSVLLALASTALAALIAIPAALALRRLRGRTMVQLLESVFLSPLIVPQLILGIALLNFFNPLGLIDSLVGLTIAHVVIVFPFMFRTVLVAAFDLDQRQLGDGLGLRMRCPFVEAAHHRAGHAGERSRVLEVRAIPLQQRGLHGLPIVFAGEQPQEAVAVVREVGVDAHAPVIAGLVDAGDLVPGRARRLAMDAHVPLCPEFDSGMPHIHRDRLRCARPLPPDFGGGKCRRRDRGLRHRADAPGGGQGRFLARERHVGQRVAGAACIGPNLRQDIGD